MAVNLSGHLTALQVMQDAPVIPVIVLTDVAQVSAGHVHTCAVLGTGAAGRIEALFLRFDLALAHGLAGRQLPGLMNRDEIIGLRPRPCNEIRRALLHMGAQAKCFGDRAGFFGSHGAALTQSAQKNGNSQSCGRQPGRLEENAGTECHEHAISLFTNGGGRPQPI